MANQINLESLLSTTQQHSTRRITASVYEINGEIIEILNVNYDTKSLKIRHNHSTHEIEFKNELDLVLDKMGIKRTFEALNTDIKAPMPGKVLNVVVSEGDEVKKGDAILILEAMKMENVLKAEGNCIIKKILINTEESVEKNQVLIELDSE